MLLKSVESPSQQTFQVCWSTLSVLLPTVSDHHPPFYSVLVPSLRRKLSKVASLYGPNKLGKRPSAACPRASAPSAGPSSASSSASSSPGQQQAIPSREITTTFLRGKRGRVRVCLAMRPPLCVNSHWARYPELGFPYSISCGAPCSFIWDVLYKPVNNPHQWSRVSLSSIFA